jgi:hypothetical protein
MWSNLVVKINGAHISDDMGLYPYKSIVPILLTTGKAEEETIGQSILFYRDTPTYNTFDATNTGFQTRKEMAKTSNTFDMVGQLKSSILNQTRYIPTGCAIEIRLTRSPPELCLDCASVDKSYSYSIEECTLAIRAMNINESIIKQHQTLFNRHEKAEYPVREYVARVNQIAKGCTSYFSEPIFMGKQPSYMIFGLIDAESFDGKLNKSNMCFKPHGVKLITVKCEEDSQKYQSIAVDYASDNFQLAYKSLFECLSNRETGNNLSRNSYKAGYCMYAFQSVPVTAASELLPIQTGNIKVSMNFKIK